MIRMAMEVAALRRIISGPVKNVTMNNDSIFYTRDDIHVFKFQSGRRKMVLNKSAGVLIVDMYTDRSGDVYMLAPDCIFIMSVSKASKTIFHCKNFELKHITVDVYNNVYVLANDGKGFNAYRVYEKKLSKLPMREMVPEPFAVDSNRRILYRNYVIDVLFKYPLCRLYSEKVNSVCVDKQDNAYFATDNGIFYLKDGSYDPIKVKGINIPQIVKIGVSPNNELYFASNDENTGGIYTLQLK